MINRAPLDILFRQIITFIKLHVAFILPINYRVSHWFGFRILSRPPLAQFSWESKPDIRSCGFTASYLFKMFFLLWEKCFYFQIFPNEVSVLIESFEKRFEATPFCHILYRWSKLFSLFSL